MVVEAKSTTAAAPAKTNAPNGHTTAPAGKKASPTAAAVTKTATSLTNGATASEKSDTRVTKNSNRGKMRPVQKRASEAQDTNSNQTSEQKDIQDSHEHVQENGVSSKPRSNNRRRNNRNKPRNGQKSTSQTQSDSTSHSVRDEINGASDLANEKPKTKPLFSKTHKLKNSKCEVTFEAIQNKRNNVFTLIRVAYEDKEMNRDSRIAVPHYHISDIITGIDAAHQYLKANKIEGIMKSLSKDGELIENLNFKKFTNGPSRYFVDWKTVDEGTDLVLKLAERKAIPGINSAHSFELYFDKSDALNLKNLLSKFQEDAEKFLKDTKVELQKVYMQDDYKLEWIHTQQRSNYLLKIQVGQNRVLYPINICRIMKHNLDKVFDVYQQCGDDMNAYLNQMREDIAEINASRQERNLQPLPELLHHPADVAEAEDALHKNESENEIRKPVYRCLYNLRHTSSVNMRRFHMDIVQHKSTGDIKLRLVEAPFNIPAKREKTFIRHTVLIPIESLGQFKADFNLAHEELPLPKEGSYYYNGGRVFFKMNVRTEGLTLKIKTQDAVAPELVNTPAAEQEGEDENADAIIVNENGQSSASSAKNNQQHRYGNTQSIEIPMHQVRFLMQYLKINANLDFEQNGASSHNNHRGINHQERRQRDIQQSTR